MKTTLKYALLMTMLISLIGLVACSDDDDGDTVVVPPTANAWEGEWLSAGTDVAPILVSLFAYDSVRVTLNSNNTVVLESHPAGGAWGTLTGVYTVTESATGEVDGIAINYTAFEQEGIVEIVPGSPDALWLEAVQTVPDIGAVPRTPATGFGSDAALGTLNIQKYRRQ